VLFSELNYSGCGAPRGHRRSCDHSTGACAPGTWCYC